MNEGEILEGLGVDNVQWNRMKLRRAVNSNEPVSFCVNEVRDRQAKMDTYTYMTISPTGAPEGHKVLDEINHPEVGRVIRSERQRPNFGI